MVEADAGLGTLHSDTVKIRQCLFNLLGNAAKFTEDGQITLSARREPGGGIEGERDWLSFAVHDSGIGMTAEQLGRLFQRFSQADESTTRQYGGTGLGLAIVKKIAEEHQGTITVSSSPHGATFVLRLPQKLDDG